MLKTLCGRNPYRPCSGYCPALRDGGYDNDEKRDWIFIIHSLSGIVCGPFCRRSVQKWNWLWLMASLVAHVTRHKLQRPTSVRRFSSSRFIWHFRALMSEPKMAGGATPAACEWALWSVDGELWVHDRPRTGSTVFMKTTPALLPQFIPSSI